MRDIGRRIDKLEDQYSVAMQPDPMTLGDFYAAINDPEHPDHEGIKKTLSHFYADSREGRPYDPNAFLRDCDAMTRARAARLASERRTPV